MHSRVFQIENNWRHLETTSSVTVDDLPNADSVWDTDNREADIDWLYEVLASIPTLVTGEDEHGKYFKLGNKKAEFFTRKYAQFIDAARRCMDVSFKDFSDDVWLRSVSDLHAAYSDEFGMFVHSFDIGVITLDHFIRIAKPQRKYYIGAVADYHW